MAILSVVGIVIFPLLFASTENRLLQRTISVVEENATQILRRLARDVRQAERIILPVSSPASQAHGSVLMLRTASGSLSPSIFGISSGSFIAIQRLSREVISSSEVAVENFHVRNTSVSPSRQSIEVSFRLSRVLRLTAPRKYEKTFQAAFTLYPDDTVSANPCPTMTPVCANLKEFLWPAVESSTCQWGRTALDCKFGN